MLNQVYEKKIKLTEIKKRLASYFSERPEILSDDRIRTSSP